MAFPQVVTEVSFEDPFSTPVWEDISAYVRGFDSQRGRQYELDRFEAGTLGVLLDNADSRFSSDNTQSPYWPNVVPMRRVRVGAGWEPLVRSLQPVAWWRLGEQSGTTAVDASGNGHDGSYEGSPTLGVPGLIVGDPDTAVDMEGNGNQGVVVADSAAGTFKFASRAPFSAFARCRAEAGGPVSMRIADHFSNTATGGWRVFYNTSAAEPRIFFDRSDGTVIDRTTMDPAPPFGTEFTVAVVYDGTDMILHVDGVEIDRTPSTLLISNDDDLGIGTRADVAESFSGPLDEPFICDYALTDDQLAALHQAATSGVGAGGYLADGYVEDWAQAWPDQGSDSIVRLTASDAFQILALDDLGGSYKAEVLVDEPVAYWTLNETSGTTADDETDNALDGTYTGSPTLGEDNFSTGGARTSVEFDGVDDWVDLGSPALLQPAQTTVEVRIKTADPNAGGGDDGFGNYIYRWRFQGVALKFDGPVEVFDSFAATVSTTGGLTWDGTNLWHATAQIGFGQISRLDPSDGTVLQQFNSPGNAPTGLAWDGTNLWHADPNTDTIYKLDPADGTVLDSFASPGTSPQGLAWDGTNLWNADLDTDTIYKLDPSDGSVLDSFAAPGSQPLGLTWDGTHLWNADAGTDTLHKLDPADGSGAGSFDAPSNSPYGLAWDGTHLWNADVGDSTIYKLGPAYVVSIHTSSGETLAVVPAAQSLILTDGNWHHLAFTADGSRLRIYVDGKEVTSVVYSGPIVYGSGQAAIARDGDHDGGYFTGNFSDLAVYDKALSPGRIAAHHAAKFDQAPAERTDLRIGKILDTIGWPAAERDLEEGQTDVLAFTADGQNVLTALQAVNTSEAGQLFIGTDGKVVFHDRHHRVLVLNESQVTFGDADTEDPNRYRELEPNTDVERLANIIEITSDGAVQVFEDEDSKGKYGPRRLPLDLQVSSTEAEARGHYELHRRADASTRLERLLIRPQYDPDLWAQALGREIGDRVTTIRRLPDGDTWTQTGVIEHINHRPTASPLLWETVWTLSPADEEEWWVLGDADLSLLGETTVVGY